MSFNSVASLIVNVPKKRKRRPAPDSRLRSPEQSPRPQTWRGGGALVKTQRGPVGPATWAVGWTYVHGTADARVSLRYNNTAHAVPPSPTNWEEPKSTRGDTVVTHPG